MALPQEEMLLSDAAEEGHASDVQLQVRLAQVGREQFTQIKALTAQVGVMEAQLQRLRQDVEGIGSLREGLESETRARTDLAGEVANQIDDLVRALREEAQDREISFTKALAQRPKNEEVMRDISTGLQHVEQVVHGAATGTAELMQALAVRVNVLEECCARHQAALTAAGDAAAGALKTDQAAITLSMQDALLNPLNALRLEMKELGARYDRQDQSVQELSSRLFRLVGHDKDGEELPQLMAMSERIDCLANALKHLDSGNQESLDRERREREVLNRVLSQRLAQEIAERTRACAKLAEEVEDVRARVGASSARYMTSPAKGSSVEVPMVMETSRPLVQARMVQRESSLPPDPRTPSHPLPPADPFSFDGSQQAFQKTLPSRSAGSLGLFVPVSQAACQAMNTSPGNRGLLKSSPRRTSPPPSGSTAPTGALLRSSPSNVTTSLRSQVLPPNREASTASAVVRTSSQPQTARGATVQPPQVVVVTTSSQAHSSASGGAGSPPAHARPAVDFSSRLENGSAGAPVSPSLRASALYK